MALTIHYRGTLDDLSQVEQFEDCVVRLSFSVGGMPTIWRSYVGDDSERVIRGVVVDMAEGVERLSLLISPEGHFIPAFTNDELVIGEIAEAPLCSVRTQFGSPLSHVCIALLMKAIRQRFASNLAIVDESNYLESGDFHGLIREHTASFTVNEQSLRPSLFTLTKEAAEDAAIIASRVQRIAALVDREMQVESRDGLSPTNEPCQHVINEIEIKDAYEELTLEEEVAWFENQLKRSELRNQRIARRIDEARIQGYESYEAFIEAMRAEGLKLPNEDEVDTYQQELSELDGNAYEPNLEWGAEESEDSFIDMENRMESPEHPAVSISQSMLLQLIHLSNLADDGDSPHSNYYAIAISGVMECIGGLVQATSRADDDRMNRALAITQLRRALRGHAFATGAITALHGLDGLDNQPAQAMLSQLKVILQYIHNLSATAWGTA